jgi:hypothetical protein
MNLTQINLSDLAPILPNQSGICINAGVIDANCVFREICQQRAASFASFGIGLIIAFLIIDMLLPLILGRLRLDVSEIKAKYPVLLARLPDMATNEGKRQAIAWLKDRLLWGFVIWAAYQIWV